jgi:type IV secretory pathway TraG/TraD family ATPase VirD4
MNVPLAKTPAGGVLPAVDDLIHHPPASLLLAAGAGVGLLGMAALNLRSGGRDQTKGRFATGAELRPLTAKAQLKDAIKLRPSLQEMSRAQRRRLPPESYALSVGTVQGTKTRVFVGYKDIISLVTPTGGGKSGFLGNVIAFAPGSAVSATTKLDLYQATHLYRRQLGDVHLLNPYNQGGLGSTIRSSPIQGCEDAGVALEQAAVMIAAGGDNSDVTNGSHWSDLGSKALACYLHAAALGGHDMATLWAWTQELEDRTAHKILSTHPQAASGWAKALYDAQADDPRHRAGVYQTIGRALRFMAHPELAKVATPDEAHPGFDIDAFILSGTGTLYIVAEQYKGAPIAPYLAGLVSKMHARAKQLSTFRPMGRLDPPITFALDEMALTVPVDIDAWAADSGGRGICVIFASQSTNQIDQRYGVLAGRTTRDAVTATIVLGGLTDADYLEDLSRVCGLYDERLPDPPRRKGEPRPQPQYRQRPRMEPDQIRELEAFHGLLLYRNVKPLIIRFRPYWEHPALIKFNAQLEAAGQGR